MTLLVNHKPFLYDPPALLCAIVAPGADGRWEWGEKVFFSKIHEENWNSGCSLESDGGKKKDPEDYTDPEGIRHWHLHNSFQIFFFLSIRGYRWCPGADRYQLTSLLKNEWTKRFIVRQ